MNFMDPELFELLATLPRVTREELEAMPIDTLYAMARLSGITNLNRSRRAIARHLWRRCSNAQRTARHLAAEKAALAEVTL